MCSAQVQHITKNVRTYFSCIGSKVLLVDITAFTVIYDIIYYQYIGTTTEVKYDDQLAGGGRRLRMANWSIGLKLVAV